IRRNSEGRQPSRERYPCMPPDAALRGWPSSQSSTRRRQRPRIRAAFNPAGPPPMMITSYGPDGIGSPPGVWLVQTEAFVSQRNGPLRHQLFIRFANRTDLTVQIVEAKLIHIAVVFHKQRIPIHLVGEAVPGESD